ncbi:MAG: PTS galactosamine/N-acetylgalactosamine transporter subunit IIA [Allobaculum sp.]
MIGLIVTGHGHFASGLTEALNVIAGPAEHYEYVDFELSDSVETLSEHLQKAMDKLSDCESIIFLSDLAGGSPFKTAVELGYGQGYEVVAGTNLGMLVEINMVRQFVTDVHELAKQALTVGKDQVQQFVFHAPVEQDEDDDFSDGI